MDDRLSQLKEAVEESFTELFAYSGCAPEETLIAVEDLEEQLRGMKDSLFDEMDLIYD